MTPFRLTRKNSPAACRIGRSNRAIAWTGFCFGAASGMIMGLWAFGGPVSPPPGFVDYADTSRRLLRLGHIAFFGIGYLNLLLAWELPSLELGRAAKQVAARCMNFANIFLPLTLMAAAAYPPLKYLLPVPATSAFAALSFAAWGAWAANRGATERAHSPSARQQEGDRGERKDARASELRALLSRRLRMDLSGIDLDASLNDALGIDSLTGLEVMVHVENQFEVYFNDEQLSRPRTLANILVALDGVKWRRAS